MWDQITDAEREVIVANVITGLAAAHVPDHLRGGLVSYFADGILPGGFQQAVLCNDLREAIGRAAPDSFVALPALLEFLTWSAPAIAWGSRDKVLAWTTTADRLEV